MVVFFFYKNINNATTLIEKINANFEINSGYILAQSYDAETNVLEISDTVINNKIMVFGKIVKFNMKLEDAIAKISENKQYFVSNKTGEFTVNTIWATKCTGGIYRSYVVY